jgi:phage-related protein
MIPFLDQPIAKLLFYQEADGHCPVAEWLRNLRTMDCKAYENCAASIERLAEFGHLLRRPTAALLRDGIHELRAKRGHVNYRILYFFHRRNVAVLVHALTKECAVPPADIERALRRKVLFETNPDRHTYEDPTP